MTYELYYWLPRQSRLFSTPFRYTAHNVEDALKVLLKCFKHDYFVAAVYGVDTTCIRDLGAVPELFRRMSHDMETMSYYGDDERALLRELLTADEDILKAYCTIWEVQS